MYLFPYGHTTYPDALLIITSCYGAQQRSRWRERVNWFMPPQRPHFGCPRTSKQAANASRGDLGSRESESSSSRQSSQPSVGEGRPHLPLVYGTNSTASRPVRHCRLPPVFAPPVRRGYPCMVEYFSMASHVHPQRDRVRRLDPN
jgi:hypothetical protein